MFVFVYNKDTKKKWQFQTYPYLI